MNIIDDRTTKEELKAEYKNYPGTMGDNVLAEKPFYESRLAPIFFEVPLGSKVLDCGANDGSMMEMLQKKRQCDVYGVDISEVAIAEAKKRGITVQYADAHKLPFEDKTFDVVILSEVISHVQNPDEVLQEIKRVLKPKGFLLGSAPHANIMRYAWEDSRMIRQYYDFDQLRTLLEKYFDRNWIRVLTGGQFAMSLASSHLANEPCEMLFKSGQGELIGWDAALQDRSILRCWFGFTQSPGTVYYRMSGFADKMQRLGAEVHYNPYDESVINSCSEWAERIRYMPSEKRFVNAHMVHQLETLLKAADMSIFQLTSSRDILLLLTTAKLGVIKKPMWVEMDDWIFDLTSYNYASHPYHPNSEAESVAFDQIKLSDGVICSTEYLKTKLTQLFPNKQVYVVRNALDFDIWDKVEKKTPLHEANKDLVRIGYTGCSNHSGDVELIKQPLLALLEEFPNLEYISLPFQSFDDVDHPRVVRLTEWSPLSKFPQAFSDWEIDIAIAPLRDHELNRAKSCLRWLESSALSIPMVASNIEPFKKAINNGKDGVVVGNSAQEWYEALKDLIQNAEKRKKIGETAYARVKKDFSMDDISKGYLSILKSIKQDFLKGKNHEFTKSSARVRQAPIGPTK